MAIEPDIDPKVTLPADPSLAAQVTESQPTSLGKHVVRGATWILIQSIIAQGLALIARIILYRQLSDAEITAASWAASACVFLGWLQPALGDALISRGSYFRLWANHAFWISIWAGAVNLAAGIVLGIILGAWKGNFQIAMLVILNMASTVVAFLPTVWSAQRSLRMKFRELAVIGTAGSIVTALGMIIMAYLKMGAWSMLAPVLIGNIVMAILLMRGSEFRPRPMKLNRRSMALLSGAFTLTLAGFFSNLSLQADNFFVGLFQGEALGIYTISYAMSFQFVQLLSRGLRGALLPALATISNDPGRRLRAYVEVISLTALACMPASILPIPLVHVMVNLLFPARMAAVPLIHCFLVGMGFVVLASIAVAALQSRKLYRNVVIANAINGILFCAMAFPVAALGNTMTMAIAVSAFYVICGTAYTALAAEPSSMQTRWKLLVATFMPFMLAGLSVAAGLWAISTLGMSIETWPGALLCVMFDSILYLILVLLLMPATVRNAWERALPLLPASLTRKGAHV